MTRVTLPDLRRRDGACRVRLRANRRRRAAVALLALCAIAACNAPPDEKLESRAPGADTLIIHLAASVTRAFVPVLDSLAAQGVVVQREAGASLDLARRITDLGRVPDIIVLADEEVFPELLAPAHVQWWAAIARNRMVIAWSDRSRAAGEMSPSTWTDVLTRPEVEVGRSDPDAAPAGYRALLLIQLAERHYRAPGLAARLLANAPPSNMRANAADLAALVVAGELDYIYEYRSVALAYGLRYLDLPPEIDLGDPAHAEAYATARTTIRTGDGGRRTVTGRPILYALSIPERAPHPAVARRFLAHMLTPASRTALVRGHLDLLDPMLVKGQGAPAEILHGR